MASTIPAWNRLWRHVRGNDPFAASSLRRTPYPVVTLFIAIVHFGFRALGKLLIVEKSQIMPAFPGLGFDLVTLLVFGTRYWPILLAFYFEGAISRHMAWLPSCGIAFASLARTFVTVALVRWIAGMKKFLGPFEDMTGIALAGVVATAIGGALGASCLAAAGGIPGSSWAVLFRRWWAVDALSLFTGGPTFLALARSWRTDRPKCSYWLALQLFVYLAAVAAACYWVFFLSNDGYLLFSAFLFVLIAAAWLGGTAARFAAVIASFAAIAATRFGIGPFAGGNLRDNLQNLALFLVAISLTGMAVGAFRAIGSLRLPACVLVAGWACSGWLYAGMDRIRTGYDQDRLNDVIQMVETRIQGSYRTYEDLGWRVAEFAANSGPEAWPDYIARVSRRGRYVGLTDLSIVKPSGDGDQERARDSGMAVLTADATTLRLFVPLYRAGAALTTVAQRRTALQGWVRVAVDRDLFFRSSLGDAQDIVRLRALDQDGIVHGARERVSRLTLGGHGWTFAWRPLPAFPYL
ncbi:MAG TPA: MASE1 domain-containing protein, partial [Bryobacteraceae bacterium]